MSSLFTVECEFCGGTEFEVKATENGKVRRADCLGPEDKDGCFANNNLLINEVSLRERANE